MSASKHPPFFAAVPCIKAAAEPLLWCQSCMNFCYWITLWSD